MGVRGLTSFIAQHAETYLTPYELHDNNLVIDGDNLACNLYRDVTGNYSAFGGDYDAFYRGVKDFLLILSQCNVRPLVLMDGGYERRKLRTVNQRMRGKIAVIKRINPNDSIPVFPILMKEVFVDAVRDCGVPVMRCVFEADEELAALARRLKCPVLSYDSDFYIHNVEYIPLITLTLKVHMGYYQNLGSAVEDAPERRLRKAEAKNLEKRSKGQLILRNFKADTKLGGLGNTLRSYRFLDCCIYRVKNLIAHGSLSKEKLPLFAALLGNDYIARSSFRNFFAIGMGRTGRSRKMRLQQKRIYVILRWLKSQTAESALEKILSRLKKNERESLKEQFYAATSGYSKELCHSFEYFMENYPDYMEDCLNLTKLKTESEEDEWIDISDDEYEDDEEVEEEEVEDNINEEDLEEEEDDECADQQAQESLVDNEQHSELDDIDEENDSDDENLLIDKTKYFPAWFLNKLYAAHLSRYFVDLLFLKKYINSPQIEHFPYPDCHEVALPILKYIFTLLYSVEEKLTKKKLNENGEVEPRYFTYMTRAPKISQVRFYRYEETTTLPYEFDPAQPNPAFIQHLFESTLPTVNASLLFDEITKLPADLRLYFLAIVYWLHKSPHYDILHLHALVISVVVLRTIDSCIPVERDIKMFNKRFGKTVKHERQVREKEFLKTGKTRSVRPDLLSLPVPERMPHIQKSDCLLVKDRLLKHFHMQEVFKKKYDQFSTIVLHGFSEFQSILFQLYGLNSLLDFPYESFKMGSCFSGVFIYNIYDSLRTRVDVRFYVQQNIFKDSQLMFDFYTFLLDWCLKFLPSWKKENPEMKTSKKVLKKQRKLANQKLQAEAKVAINTNEDMLSEASESEPFIDLNNKFNTFLTIVK